MRGAELAKPRNPAASVACRVLHGAREPSLLVALFTRTELVCTYLMKTDVCLCLVVESEMYVCAYARARDCHLHVIAKRRRFSL